MRLSSRNFILLHYILISWLKVFFQIHFHKPARYLEILHHQAPPSTSVTDIEWAFSKKVVRGVRKIRFFFRKNRRCLMESLIVFEVLHRFGIHSNLQFGVRKENDSFQTHAWVTLEEKTIIGGPTVNYRKLIRIH